MGIRGDGAVQQENLSQWWQDGAIMRYGREVIKSGNLIAYDPFNSVFTTCCRKPLTDAWPLMALEGKKEILLGHAWQCSGCFKVVPHDPAGHTVTLRKGVVASMLKSAWEEVKESGLQKNSNGLPGAAYWFVIGIDGKYLPIKLWKDDNEAPIQRELKSFGQKEFIPSHGQRRIDVMAANAYQSQEEPPEMDDVPF